MFDLSKIKPNPENPRSIDRSSLDKLAKSIVLFHKMMVIKPIVIDEKGINLAGNQRFKAIRLIIDSGVDFVEGVMEKKVYDGVSEEDQALDREATIDLFTEIIREEAVPDEWVRKAENLTDKEKTEFIIKDNTEYGVWDWDVMNEEDWGLLQTNKYDWGLRDHDFDSALLNASGGGNDDGEEGGSFPDQSNDNPGGSDNVKTTKECTCPNCGEKFVI